MRIRRSAAPRTHRPRFDVTSTKDTSAAESDAAFTPWSQSNSQQCIGASDLTFPIPKQRVGKAPHSAPEATTPQAGIHAASLLTPDCSACNRAAASAAVRLKSSLWTISSVGVVRRRIGQCFAAGGFSVAHRPLCRWLRAVQVGDRKLIDVEHPEPPTPCSSQHARACRRVSRAAGASSSRAAGLRDPPRTQLNGESRRVSGVER